MKKKIRIITIVVFVIAAIPITTYIRKGNEKSVEQFKQARIVETEQAFAEALKIDGWIYAKGAFTGQIPIEKLREGSKTLNITVDLLSDYSIEPVIEEAINSLKGDFFKVWLKVGKVKWDKTYTQHTMDSFYTANAEAESVSFLGQTFNPDKIIPLLSKREKTVYPEKRNTLLGYELETIKSPYKTWIEVLVADGKIMEKELSLTADEHMQQVKAAAKGKTNSMNTSITFEFLGFWFVLMFVVLCLEGKCIKS